MFSKTLVEIRPRLGCANVSITLKVDTSCTVRISNCSVDVTQEGKVESIVIKGYLPVENSLSSLLQMGGALSFRFLINKVNNLGSYKAEVIAIEEQLNNMNLSCFNWSDVKGCISCQQCGDIFSERSFNRILPLPSDQAEPNDWFCHAHAQEKHAGNPKDDDLFYSACYVHVNYKSAGKCLLCKKCRHWLGVRVNADTVKLWLNTVKIDEIQTEAFKDVVVTLEDVFRDSLLSSIKIILNCQRDEEECVYLLLWVLEKDLHVYKSSDEGSCSSNVCKVLYSYNTGQTDLVKQWFKDGNTVSVAVSVSMIDCLLKNLANNGEFIMAPFRVANGLNVSFIEFREDI